MSFFKKNIDYIYYTIALVLMISVFFTNLFGILDPSFKNFQKDDEGLIYGRLALTKHEGFFERSGLVGVYGEWGDPKFDQKKIYLSNTKIDKTLYNQYQSQVAGQGMIYATLDSLLPFKNETKISIFYFLTAFCTSLAFLFFLVWVKRHFGLLTSIITLLLLLTSFWIIIFSSKLWWNLWSFYVPFVFMLFFLDKKNSFEISCKKLFIFSFATVFIKCFISGYDYISPTLVMFTTPLFFYSILYNWKIKKTIRFFIIMSTGAITGFLATIGVLIFQISQLPKKVDNLNAIEYIYSTILRRSYDDPNSHSGKLFYDSMKSTVWEVIQLYLNGPIYKYKTKIGTEYEVSFLAFILFLFCLTFLYTYLSNKKTFFSNSKNIFKALLIMLWVSILAPMSWYILFKGHSYIHTHINFIAWYMPFALLGYVFIGYFVSEMLFRKKIV